MFLEYYGVREQPFGVTPDPRFLYFGEGHREALASLFYGIESGCGFLGLIASPGLGKTTLLFHLLEKLRNSAQTVFLFQTQCGSREMFRHLLNDLGIDSAELDLAGMHEALNSVLLNNARKGRRVVVVIDEAQNLKNSVLETVRLLSDFETPQSKLLQIVLSGQPQLADNLSDPGMTQLRQRISVIARLHPFARVETLVYMEYRLSKAGYSGPPLFTYGAADLIATKSRGNPRTINNLCFNAMTLGFAKRQKQIDAATVSEVLADLDLDGISTHHSAAPEVVEDSLFSFDGISPSNDLTYQDFHDAVRAAWGDGTPVRIENRPAQEGPKWVEPDSVPRPVDATLRMSLQTEGTTRTSVELDQSQKEGNGNGSGSLPIPTRSPVALADQVNPQAPQQIEGRKDQTPSPAALPGPEGYTAKPWVRRDRAAQLENKNAPSGSPRQPMGHAKSPNATEDKHRQNRTEQGVSSAASPTSATMASSRGREILKATWEAVSQPFQGAHKKETGPAEENRAARRGTIIAVAFALTTSGLMFGWRHHEIMQPTLNDGTGVSARSLVASSLPSASLLDSRDSRTLNMTLSSWQILNRAEAKQ
jgi:general secretion pathway protein A